MVVSETPCCKYVWQQQGKDKGPIFWNPFNKAVQCHSCGQVYEQKVVTQ